MPLARITAPIPEYSDRLAQDLRARGFDVENASPGQYFPTAADLEISVRQCAPEDAGKIAAASTKDMCVLMSPGARDTGIRSIEMVLLQPKTAAAAVRHIVTPAQAIEISAGLLSAETPSSPEVAPPLQQKTRLWAEVKTASQSTWDEIAKTTANWMKAASAAMRNRWEKVNVKAFFAEVGEETRKLGTSISAGLSSAVRRTTTNVPDENEQLVPSMFDFSEELSSEEEKPVIEMPKPRAAVDRRVWRALGAAGLAAIAVLLVVSLRHKSSQSPAAATAPVENKGPLPATASLKPSAVVGAKGPVHMVSARQVIHSEASDTVVRYGNHKSAPKPADSHPGIKRYSDLD
jgi:hypothetical protein